MTKVFEIEDVDKKILFKILENYKNKIYAYGSRVKGTAQKFSDLDLCYKGDIDKIVARKLKEELRNSDLKIKVDLVNYNECTQEFQNLIKDDLVALSTIND